MLGPSDFWPGNRKAELLLSHPSERFAFFDADMIVTQATLFSSIESWIEVAPVFSVASIMLPIDYRRQAWARRLKRSTRSDRWPTPYFNTGFFAGMLDRDRPLLQEWDAKIREVLTPPSVLWSDPDFHTSDQDVLNAVLQDWEGQIIGMSDTHPVTFPFPPSMLGPATILHCIGLGKPWTLTKPPARSPNLYELAWHEHVIARPTLISIPHRLPFSIRRWLERRIESRATVAYHRLLRALRGSLE
jgi:lipopolysaccharide biosynthesis glycosyltransferase